MLLKLIKIFFLGQLVGLPTMKSILTKYDKSCQRQTDYANLCKSLSNSQIRSIFESVFEQYLIQEFSKMLKKHNCTWSRELTTVVLDDSVFMSWLGDQESFETTADCYGKFFSGQFGKAVFGFQAVCLGVVIDKIYYPLYIECARKPKKDESAASKKEKGSKGVAIRLVQKWGKFYRLLHHKGMKIPQFCFSCDSGYSDKELLKACADNFLHYISVPKKSHTFTKDGLTIKLNVMIDDFLKLEAAHLQAGGKSPFTYRNTAYYNCIEQEVVLLFFRLNGSKKVSVIYTVDLNIKAKTLRRNWFQRTYIEQYFKTLKHVLKIQEARTKTKHGFDCKLFRFSLIALHAQKLIRTIRKSIKGSIPIGFQTLQRLLADDPNIKNLLNANLERPFAK